MGPTDTTATQLVFDIGRNKGFVYFADLDTHVEQVWETGLIHFLPGVALGDAGRHGRPVLANADITLEPPPSPDLRTFLPEGRKAR
jgi:hypothetical protein